MRNISLILAQLPDIDIILEFIQELYGQEGIRFDETLARRALEKLIEDDAIGNIPFWQIYLFIWAVESRLYNLMRYISSRMEYSRSLGYVWLIYSDGEAIGYVTLTFSYSLEFGGRDALIDELYIREGYRGAGIGTKVLEFMTYFCKYLGIKAIHLVVERKNNQAHSLYRKMGFEDCHRDIMTKWIG